MSDRRGLRRSNGHSTASHSAPDAESLRHRVAERGYVDLRGLLDPEELRSLRSQILRIMEESGWLAPGSDPEEARPGRAPREGGDGWWHGYAAIQSLEALHRLGNDRRLLEPLEILFGGPVLAHPRRIVGITNPSYGTPSHQDFFSIQGAIDTFSAWVPLDDRSGGGGGIRLLETSGLDPLYELHWIDGVSAGTNVPEDDPRWVTSDWKVGDAVLYHSLTVHSLLPNVSDRILLACEFRFQAMRDPICLASLKPHHFPRVPGWPQLTRDWETTTWIRVPRRLNTAPFVMPRKLESWHLELQPSLTRSRWGMP